MTDLPKFPLTEEGVTAALADLDKGGSEDVAIRFEELGATGRRDNASTCPVACYLKTRLPDAEYVVVEREHVYLVGIVRRIIDGFTDSADVRLSVELPDSVSAFVEDFDQGIYPQLIEGGAAA